MGLKIEDDNPFMKRYMRKLSSAREKHNSLKNLNEDNKRNVESLSTRNMENGDDTLSFIIKLSDDQQELDLVIEDTKKLTEDLLKLLNNIKGELEESDKTSKEEILNECKQMLTIESKKLPNLEDKLVKLEKGVNESSQTTEMALRILDKSNPEYSKVTDLDKDLKHLQKDTSEFRTEKTRISSEISSLLSKINTADLSTISMLEILTIQKQSSKIVSNHAHLSTNITDGLSRLKSLHLLLTKILQALKDHLAKAYDTESTTLNNKLHGLKRFLTPTGKVPDSLQRPKGLKELLDAVYLSKEDPDYSTYIGYTELVRTNLTKCDYAVKDLNRLEGDVEKVVTTYQNGMKKADTMVSEIEQIQNSLEGISQNQTPANELSGVIDGILVDLDAKKEQEIIDFLNNIKGQRFKDAQEKFSKLQFDTSELERRIREVNEENEEFTGQLNKAAKTSKNREKTNLIDLLLRESDGSRRDLKKIQNDTSKQIH
jgi:hypothetical protein